MNKLSIAKVMMLAMSMVGIAHANNKWTGFYAGVETGFAFSDTQLKSQQLGFTDPSDTCNDNSDLSTFFPGIQLGYLHQFPNDYVAGIEANATINTNQQNSLSCKSVFNSSVYDGFTFRNQMQTSLKGRLGHDLNWNNNTLLPYLTAGASFANVGLTYKNEGGDYYSKNTSQLGWLIGAGIEWAFRQHWSVRAEYYYVDYGDAINLKIPSVYGLLDPNGTSRVNVNSNNVVIAINYWV